ncbi:tRNA (adenosine(37)-N6)-threonylcarbamoyltransferase complex dimerization subunit type 1 TsaB [Niveibacterium sp.]|uniref:tRNA (adenosine(37)-N6)-threonylcarbamoyltransferase complex dimerization subunit type 1 TsaB n=1 Tax=Niveibacterium sp. TaxID=2017444 RepID=UPI0035B35CFB
MNWLAIETSGNAASIALQVGDRIESDVLGTGNAPASGEVLAGIAALLVRAGVTHDQLDGIAVGVGPGAFTGVRVACSVAQGLSLAKGIPVVPVVSLDAVAQSEPADAVLAVLDARMGEVYWARYRRDAGGLLQREAMGVCGPDALAVPDDVRWTVCGAGFTEYREQFSPALLAQLDTGDITAIASAAQLLTWRAAMQVEAVAPEALAPCYVRDKVALTTAERVAKALKA